MLGRLFKTSTFRLAFISVSLFAVLGMSLLGFVYWSTRTLLDTQINSAIETEIAGLADIYKRRGAIGLVAAIDERVGGFQGRRHLYLVVDERGTPLVGNMNGWPDEPADEDGWITFHITVKGDRDRMERVPARARAFSMEGNLRLLVGRDMSELVSFRGVIETSMLWSIGFTLLLGVIGGLLMSRNVVRRIDVINRTARTIFKGDLSQRMPVSGTDDEYDQLSQNLNAMLERIHKLVTAMREVTDNVAHDLRSPLNRLRSRLEVTLLGKPDKEEYEKCIAGAIEDTDSILSTFNALLSIARIEGESSRADFTEVDLPGVALDVAELYQPVAEDKEQTLIWHLPESGCPDCKVIGDQPLIGQAIANLIDNAIKYSPAGSLIKISVDSADGWVRAIICDNGPGVPEEARKSVLDRFVRLEASRHTPGTGLGLSLVAAVAERHGAKLELQDNAPGLRVVLFFPGIEPENNSRKWKK